MSECGYVTQLPMRPGQGEANMDSALVVLYISRSLSYSVIVLSFCMKFPQILNILSSKSSKGLSTRGYWMEIACYLIGSSYGYFYDFHISTYGEALLLAIQSAVIIGALVYFGRQWSLENALWFSLTVVFCIGSVFRVVPVPLLNFLLLCTLPLSATSKLIQVWGIYRLKSKGDVSMLMWGLDAYSCAARLFTTAVEVKDVQVFVSYLISFLLNTTVVLQCLYYGDKPKAK